MHKRFMSQHRQSEYGLGEEQSALIASTLANLAQAASMNPNQLPNISNQQNPNQKIFHVDAYCYLCKKEFCNKYFLRTHLANKHKVFLNSNDLSTLTGASMSKLQNDLFKEHQQNKRNNNGGQHTSSNKTKSNGSSGNTNGRSSSASSTESTRSSRTTSSLSNSPNSHQQSMTIANVLYNKNKTGHDDQLIYNTNNNSINTTTSNHTNTANTANGNTSSSMVEDFCELCNKQFCNKYYLKKHKFDVHGILVENNIKSYKKIDDSPQQQTSTIKQQQDQSNIQHQRTNVNSSSTTNTTNNQPTNNTSFNFPGLNNQSHSLALANMMFVNPYMSPMMQLPHILPVIPNTTVANTQLNQQVHESNQHPAIAKNIDHANNNNNNNASPISSSSSSSSSSKSASSSSSNSATNMAIDILSRLNNTETSTNNSKSPSATPKPATPLPAKSESEKMSVACDLCKKEFFNEEFLKLHRINKHKILPNPAETLVKTASTPPALANSSPAASNGNLSPRESPQPLTDVENLQKLLQQQHKDLLLTNSSKQTISSSNSLQTKPTANAPNNLIKQFPSNFDINSIAGISTPAIFGIMDSYFAAKMADRVTCDICNKQVCNKYFLKTHKLKVHGIADNGSGDSNEQNEYEMNEDMMNEMANEVTGRMTNETNESNSGDNSNEGNDTMSIARQLQNSLSQLRATSSPNKALAQLFNKSTLAAMGLDQQNNAAALAATLANLSNYNPMAMNGGNTGMGSHLSSQQKPKPPALARVSCQICRKELCNKYFLKSHLLNAHHISADDLYMNNMLEQQQQSPPSQNSQGEKLLKAFNMFNGEQQRQTESPAASMRSNSSNYTGNSSSNKKILKQGSEDLEDGQQQNDEEETGKTQSSFNALMNYAGSPKGGQDSLNTLAFGAGCNMQPFLFECKDESFLSNFVPCMVYLPVKSKLEMPVNIKVTLKPLDAESVAMAAASMNKSVSQAEDENEEDTENF